MMDGWDTGMGALGWTLMIVLWVVLIALIGLAIARLMTSEGRSGTEQRLEERPGPRRLLDERLARGEIDLETYERLKEALTAEHAPSELPRNADSARGSRRGGGAS